MYSNPIFPEPWKLQVLRPGQSISIAYNQLPGKMARPDKISTLYSAKQLTNHAVAAGGLLRIFYVLFVIISIPLNFKTPFMQIEIGDLTWVSTQTDVTPMSARVSPRSITQFLTRESVISIAGIAKSTGRNNISDGHIRALQVALKEERRFQLDYGLIGFLREIFWPSSRKKVLNRTP